MGLKGDYWAELWGVPFGGLQVSKDKSTESGGDINGEMRRWDGFITVHVDLIPNS